MNHYADIEEGQEVFQDEIERRAAEAHFRQHPREVHITLDGVTVVPTVIHTIMLTGSLRSDHRVSKPHPFDFEEGYIEAVGLRNGEHGPQYATVVVRWSDFGKTLSGSIG